MKNILLFVLLFSLGNLKSLATHLIGGEMTYTCLGNDLYEISLVIYVDCGPSNTTGTSFDQSGIITVYNSSNQELQQITISDPSSTLLSDQTAGNDCLELPSDLCIEQGVYTTIVELPPIQGGYQIAYQRCCRNPSIINVPSPGDIGSTFVIYIPGSEVISDCNSSPVFNNYPPLALCLGDEVNLDLSAFDSDGDSLVYELTTPLLGANDLNPTEITPPPFNPIPWQAGYSDTYPLDSNPSVEINTQSGILTGTPIFMGMFIVGIKVKEYRNEVFIGEIIRDFRFLVVDCNVITASFPLSSWYCNSLNVEFENNSNNADSYYWDFGENNTSSSLFEPNHTYLDTGTYTVTLIANPNTICADTNIVTFPLFTELTPYFENPEPECIDNNNFSFMGEGLIPEGSIFYWDFGSLANPPTSNAQDPTGINFTQTGIYPISFNIQFEDCDETFFGEIEVFDEDIFPEIPPVGSQCFENNSYDFFAQGIFPENATFSWNFGPNALSQTSDLQNPTNISFNSSGPQEIILNISANGCEKSTTTSIEVQDEIGINITNSPVSGCEPLTVQFESNLDPLIHSFNWDLGNGTNSNSANSTSSYNQGNYDISLIVFNLTDNCGGTIQLDNFINVEPQPESYFTLNSSELNLGESLEISNESVFANSYMYEFSSGYITTEENPIYTPPINGEIDIWQFAMNNELACIDSSYAKIYVDYEYTVWIPNAFTPNQDGENDEFFPILYGIPEYRLEIFDRWGKLVYDKYGTQPRWNGELKNGVISSSNSFAYILQFETLGGEKITKKGVVNLIR